MRRDKVKSVISRVIAARASIATILLAIAIAPSTSGCAMWKQIWPSSDDSAIDEPGDNGAILPDPMANIAITYKRSGDTLERATVLKFFGADSMPAEARQGGSKGSLFRFDGGVPIWEFKAQRSAIGEFAGLASQRYSVKGIEYGKVPPHFAQVIPDEGPPEPLDRGSFYVFQVERSSGSVSYQAVKVQADGSLIAYNAQPRAGNSYVLCCNVAGDFTEPVVMPDESPPDDQPPVDQPPPDQGAPDSGAPMP
jgi:hypothetical protein